MRIARNSSFTYKGRAVKAQQVAEELGVRYVLEGSVQPGGDRLRVTAQMVDAVDGRRLWAERHDRELTGASLLDIQDDVAARLFQELHVELTLGDAVRTHATDVDDLDAARRLMEGQVAFQRFTAEGSREALRLYGEMLADHADDPIANTMVGWAWWRKAAMGMTDDPATAIANARRHGEAAVAAGPGLRRRARGDGVHRARGREP